MRQKNNKGGEIMEQLKLIMQEGLWAIVAMVLIALGIVCLIKMINTFIQSIELS